MEFSDLALYLPAIEREIRRAYAAERRRAGATFAPYVDTLSEFTLRGGKRLRALLVLGGYYLGNRRSPEAAIGAAAALEHFQSWMLIHDDIIDHSEQRRGGPTVHRLVEGRHREEGGLGDSPSYGVGIGITLGDLQEPFTVEAILSSPVPLARRVRAIEEYVRMTRLTAYGQLLDIQNGATPVSKVREVDLLRVHELKTAVYTVASPLRIGAALAGGRATLLDDLNKIGMDLGVAFQLRDDVLGAGFDSEAAGKSANDLIEGKRTLLVLKAWAGATEDGRHRLELVLGNPHSSEAAVDAAREVIRSTGSLAYSERKISQLSGRALRRVEKSRNLDRKGKDLLGELAEKLVRRAM
ncbi:MAG: polyprenyl synthetase family protein [Thermoplasmata archaeon]|nr:polyprenyl synthetase family protein [Thermoplasmata archaeon]